MNSIYVIIIIILILLIITFISKKKLEKLVSLPLSTLVSAATASAVCTNTSQVCSDCSVSSWGDCKTNGTQIRTIIKSASGTGLACPSLTQPCQFNASNCKYSEWSPCSNGGQNRTVILDSVADYGA